MPLHLAHHKSYHPYNRANIERVQRDEAAERARLEGQEARARDADSEARIEALRRARDGKAREIEQDGAQASSSGYALDQDAIRAGKEADRRLHDAQGHINFWADLEEGRPAKRPRSSAPGASSQPGGPALGADPSLPPPASRAYLSQPSRDEPSPWYASADLVGGRERAKSSETRLEEAWRDGRRKRESDPMNAVRDAFKQPSHEQRPPAYSQPLPGASPARSDNHAEAQSREAAERARAEALIARRRLERQQADGSPGGGGGGRGGESDIGTPAAWAYSDQFNRDEVRAAHSAAAGARSAEDRRWRREQEEREADLRERARERMREREHERERTDTKEGRGLERGASPPLLSGRIVPTVDAQTDDIAMPPPQDPNTAQAGEATMNAVPATAEAGATQMMGAGPAKSASTVIGPAVEAEGKKAGDAAHSDSGIFSSTPLKPPAVLRTQSNDSTDSSATGSSSSSGGRLSTPSSGESDPEVVRRYRESMYPTLLGEMIDVVLEHEAYLFAPHEEALLRAYAPLPYEARYLLARLVQRKDAWIRLNKLEYKEDITDLQKATKDLCQTQLTVPTAELDEPAAAAAAAAGDGTEAPLPATTTLRFAMSEADMDADMGAILNMLTLDELKILAKSMQRLTSATKTKPKIIEALLGTGSQGTLGFASKADQAKGKGKAAAKPEPAPPTPAKKKPQQMTLNFGAANKAAGPLSAPVAVAASTRASPTKVTVGSSRGQHSNQKAHLQEELAKLVGKCVRLDARARKLIDRVALIYYRGNVQQGASALTTAVLSRSRKRNYPRYVHARSPRLWPSRAHLLAYEAALATELEMEQLLEWDGSKEAFEKAYRLFESSWEEWKAAVAECEAGLPEGVDRLTYHRMRFHAGWILTRVVYKGTYCLGRLKLYEREKEVLTAMLAQRAFRRGKRGEWYDRLALILMQYSEDKTAGRKEALKVCMRGLQDPNTHLIYHSMIQRRIKRLESALRVPFSEQHDFSYAQLKQCTEVTFSGVRLDQMLAEKQKFDLFGRPIQAREASPEKRPPLRADSSSESIATGDIGKNFVVRKQLQKEVKIERRAPSAGGAAGGSTSPSTSRVGSPVKGGPGAMPPPPGGGDDYSTLRKETRVSMATVWRGLDGEPCRVEGLCLQHYAKEGFKGYHTEGGVLVMLYVMLMWDIIFAPMEGAFETAYQSAPLDFNTDVFAVSRSSEIRARLLEIEQTGGLHLIRETDERERERKTWAVGCRWDAYPLKDLLEIAECIGGQSLAVACQIFSEDWEHCHSGLPDLCIWRHPDHLLEDEGEEQAADALAEAQQSASGEGSAGASPGKKRKKTPPPGFTAAVRFVEVKGPGDQLRENQKLWIDLLQRCGIETQLAYVVEKCAKDE